MDQPKQRLPPLTRHLLRVIGDHFDFNDCSEPCYPSIDRLAARSGMSKRAVQIHIAKAVEAGWLSVERRQRDKNGGPHGYPINHYSAAFPPHDLGAPDASKLDARRASKSRSKAHGVHDLDVSRTNPDARGAQIQTHDVRPTLSVLPNHRTSQDHAAALAPERCADRIVITRQMDSWARWTSEADKRDRELGNRMRAQRTFAAYVVTAEPFEGCPLPELVSGGSTPPPSAKSSARGSKKVARQ